MKDIHLKINPILEMFARGCAIHQIHHYYHGHSHHTRGIHMTFKVTRITTDFVDDLMHYFSHFTIRNERGYLEVVICLFEDDDLPF